MEKSQMAPVDRRGAAGTRGTEVTDNTIIMVDGKKRIKGALWLGGQVGRKRKRT